MQKKSFISNPVIKTLVYANVFIAICSAAQVVVTYLVFNIPFDVKNTSFIAFIFLSTYLQYNVQRGYLIKGGAIHAESAEWLTKHKKMMLYSVGISLITVLFLCNNLSYVSIGIMVGAEVISTIYYLPPFHIRKHGYFKPLIIALIWVISCSAVPLIENNLLTVNSGLFLASQFCFITVLCILFDVKDMDDDYLNGINTYANKFGIFTTKLICCLWIVITGIFFYLWQHTASILVGELIVLAITSISVFLTNENKHRFYYYLWIDGVLLLQAMVFYICLHL